MSEAVRSETSRTVGLLRGVVIAGHWQSGRHDGSTAASELADFHHCPDPRQVPVVFESSGADWLVIGRGYDDPAIDRLLWAVRLRREDFKLAILGDAQEWRRAEQWVRRGCDLYLEHTASPERLLDAMRLSERLRVSVIDSAFHQTLRKRGSGPTPSLTRREREVLDLLGRGLRNWEIGKSLYISENTVEYHVRHLLQKLGARNRIEAYRQAIIMGIT